MKRSAGFGNTGSTTLTVRQMLTLAAIRKIEQKPAPTVVPPALVRDRQRPKPGEEEEATP